MSLTRVGLVFGTSNLLVQVHALKYHLSIKRECGGQIKDGKVSLSIATYIYPIDRYMD